HRSSTNRPFSARPYAVLPGARPVARLPRGRGWLPRKQPRSHQPDLVEMKCGYAGVLKHGEEGPPRQARTGLDAQSPTSERGYGTSHQMRRRGVAQLVSAGGAYCSRVGGGIPPGSGECGSNNSLGPHDSEGSINARQWTEQDRLETEHQDEGKESTGATKTP